MAPEQSGQEQQPRRLHHRRDAAPGPGQAIWRQHHGPAASAASLASASRGSASSRLSASSNTIRGSSGASRAARLSQRSPSVLSARFQAAAGLEILFMKARKWPLFEKSGAKTFVGLGPWRETRTAQFKEVFCFFFQKRSAFFFHLTPAPALAHRAGLARRTCRSQAAIGSGRFLKKRRKNFCWFGSEAAKPARPSLKKFFASFFQKRSFLVSILTPAPARAHRAGPARRTRRSRFVGRAAARGGRRRVRLGGDAADAEICRASAPPSGWPRAAAAWYQNKAMSGSAGMSWPPPCSAPSENIAPAWPPLAARS